VGVAARATAGSPQWGQANMANMAKDGEDDRKNMQEVPLKCCRNVTPCVPGDMIGTIGTSTGFGPFT